CSRETVAQHTEEWEVHEGRCFFFSSRRRHTRCYRDWSSDVCSSDLVAASPATERFRPIWRAVATSVVPEAAQLGATEWAEVEAIVTGALAARPARTQRQVALFLTLLDWLPLVRYGRRLRALDGARRARVLSLLQRAPSLLIRRGSWGVRTLVL